MAAIPEPVRTILAELNASITQRFTSENEFKVAVNTAINAIITNLNVHDPAQIDAIMGSIRDAILAQKQRLDGDPTLRDTRPAYEGLAAARDRLLRLPDAGPGMGPRSGMGTGFGSSSSASASDGSNPLYDRSRLRSSGVPPGGLGGLGGPPGGTAVGGWTPKPTRRKRRKHKTRR